jgi:S1-C subfamily serine protease
LPADTVGVHPWTANLIGLLLGSAIGGAALAVVLPQAESHALAPGAAVKPGIALAAPQPDTLPAIIHPDQPRADDRAPPPKAAPSLEPRPVEMPRIAVAAPQPGPLPNIIHPDPPPARDGPHRPGTGVTGTGFFVAADGSLLTAAHVVSGCRETRIASQLVRPSVARLVASDAKQDIALLRAAGVKPPATLSIGFPAAAGGRLFVLGYPASGGPLIPTEAWAMLENDALQPAPAELIDPHRVIWAAAPEVNRGFSGGPILDPRNGAVVGIVRGMVDSTRLHAARAAIPASGMVTGPGSAPLAALLRQEGTGTAVVPVSGNDALDIARRATVHVLCLY